MNHYADFDPYVIRQRNEQTVREVTSLRLEAELRQNKDDQERKEKKTMRATTNYLILRKVLLALAAMAASLLMVLGTADLPAQAQSTPSGTTITVNTNVDEDNSDGDCSLREAIQAANTNQAVDACVAGSSTEEDSIIFALGPEHYGFIRLGSTLPTITDAAGLTIDGALDGAYVRIDGNDRHQVLVVSNGAKLALQNLTVARGVNNLWPAGQEWSSSGGGVYNDGGILTVTNSTFRNNTADGNHGAGGAIYNEAGTLTVTNSTFYYNAAGRSGGGIYADGPSTVTVTNSTFSDNAARDHGGGISNMSGPDALTVTHSTFARNNAVVGVSVYGPATLRNTILTNVARSPDDPSWVHENCNGGFYVIDGGYNISSDDSCGLSEANNSLSNADPLIAVREPLDNGGPTKTIALRGWSPAIDAIPEGANGCSTDITQDQRGEPRPQDGDNDGTAACDIGAFEVQDESAPVAPTITSPEENSVKGSTFSLSGTAEANSSVELFEGANSVGTEKADSSGGWTIELTGVSEGSHSYKAMATDRAGNTSAESEARTVIVDATVPEKPSITSPAEGARLKVRSFNVSGSAEAGAKVELFEGEVSKGEATADPDGEWSIALSGVSDGSHSYKAKATDAAANASAFSDTRTVIVDTVAPRVKRVVPAENATGILPGTNVAAVFSETMRPGSATNAFRLYKKGSAEAIAATVTYEAATQRAVLNPDVRLARGTTYRAVVTVGARDKAGNQLDQDRTLTGNQPKAWFFTINP